MTMVEKSKTFSDRWDASVEVRYVHNRVAVESLHYSGKYASSAQQNGTGVSLTSPFEIPNAASKRALRQLRSGEMNQYENLEDLRAELDS